LEVGVRGDGFVEVVDVGGVMFVVMQTHGFRVDIRFERIGCVGKRGEGERAFLHWGSRVLLSYIGFGLGDGGQESRSEGGAEEEFEEVTAGDVGHEE